MIKTKDEIISMLSARIGEDNSDESIALFEDISDTLTDYENRTADSTDWKQRYEENDNEWRVKYKERFMSSGSEEEDKKITESENEEKKYTFESLFVKE